MNIQKVKIGEVKPNKDNQRVIKKDKLKKLVESVKDFPQMLEIRPIVVDENNVILGGNMRYEACKIAGIEEVYIIKASDLDEDQKKEFIVKDNVGFGEWDWDVLANQYEIEQLDAWGLDVGDLSVGPADDFYSKKIDAPKYEPLNSKPDVDVLVDNKKMKELIDKINQSNISDEDKEFLRLGAYRHLVYDYAKIADYYANSSKEVQELMEQSALVIIDFDKAIENGYVRITEQIAEEYGEE